MKIAAVMGTFIRGRMGGTEIFTDELIPRISQILSQKDGTGLTQVLPQTTTPYDLNSDVIELKTPSKNVSSFSKFLNYLYLRFFSRLPEDISLAFYPFTAVVPRPRSHTKSVVTIHDLQHLDFPHMFSLSQKIYRKMTYERSAKKVDAVVVISEFTRQSVHSKLKIPLENIHLIYPGINHDFFSYTKKSRTSTSSPSFIYYPARALPHKNHARLFEAMEIVRKKYPDLGLVLTGADGNNLGSLPSFVTHKGHVTREEVRELYLTASCLVFPSLYEGFGFPPLEAMAVGCPVVTSLSGSLKEICNNSAFVIDPLSAEDIARGILEALAEPDKYTQVGIQNVAKFNWDIAAKEHVELFEKVLEAN